MGVLLMLLAGGIALWFWFSQPAPVKTQCPVIQFPTNSIGAAAHPAQLLPPAVASQPAAIPAAQAISAQRGAAIVDALLHTRPGQITANEAQALVKELVSAANFAELVRPLLASQEVADRLLGVYLMLEGGGLTDEMRALALTDPSPYVRAEVVNWLFLKQDFAALEGLVRQGALKLSANDMRELVSLAATAAEAEVPVAMHRLRLGRGVFRYLSLLAGQSPDLAAAVTKTLGDTQVPADGRIRLLGVLSTVRPPDYQKVLEKALDTESVLSMRCQLTRNLAALTSAADTQRKTLLESRFLNLPEPLRPQFPYREQVVEQVRQLDQELRTLCAADTPETARLSSVMKQYLDAARLLGPEAPSAETLDAVAACSARLAVPLPKDLLADAAFTCHVISQGGRVPVSEQGVKP
jgi:hypothetical protein